MKFTGEFFVPYTAEEENINNPELEIEHKQRYLSILKMVEGKTVLDIASGEGYGTSILSSSASQVFGVDINPELVEHASRKYPKQNIRFLNGSVENIPLESNSIDVIVSFETLEHVPAEVQRQFLREVKRVLKAYGIFIVSTPNKKNYTDRYNHQNKFHIHELYRDDFEKLLKAHFGHVLLYDQGLEVSSLFLQKKDYLEQNQAAIVPVTNNYHFEGKYLIGVCSDLPEAVQLPIASIVPETEKSYFQLIDRILQLQREVEELGAWGTRSAAELETFNARISQLQQEADQQISKAKVEERQAFEQDILNYENIIKTLQEHLARANHSGFLKEAELTVIRKQAVPRPLYSSGIEKFTSEIARLTDTISGKETNGIVQSSREKTRLVPARDPAVMDLKQQITKLQEDILWYKKTYEEKSLLGIIKQKLADKFRK